MVEIGRTIISNSIFEEYFLCNLLKCRGACCIEGESGAPLTRDEAETIEKKYPTFRKYLPEEHCIEIEKQGFSVIDSDGDRVTPLVNKRQCAFSFRDKYGILKCSIEKAFLKGKTEFRKPLSCHLFPIRIKEYDNFDAINYEQLEICNPGRKYGKDKKIQLYHFLKEPLIRKYGEEWYKEVEMMANYLVRKCNKNEHPERI